jgi:micrococcal nuclease
MNQFKILALAVALAASAPAFANDHKQQGAKLKCDRENPIENQVTVEKNADGDTISVRARKGVYSVRLIGIDTPESKFRGESQGEWADAASERLQEMLPAGKKVRLEISENVCDQYGRVLAHVFVGKSHVNKELVREGLAANYCVYPSLAHCQELGLLTEEAMKKRIGMFSDPSMELPYDFRRRIKGSEQASFVGSLRTKKVLRPGNQNRVPVAERVFFFGESSVEAPFYIAN